MAAVNPVIAAILIIGILLLTIVLVMVIINRQSSVTPNSQPTAAPCIQAPDIPTGLAVSNPQGDLLVLTWNSVAGAETYTAYIGDEPSFNTENALGTKTTRFSSASFANLTLGQNYYFKLFSTNSCGNSALSTEFVFNLPYAFPQRFIIASLLNTSAILCDEHTSPFSPTDRVWANIYCDPLDTWSFFESSDNSIRQSSRSNYCLTRSGTSPGQILFAPCTGGSTQKWAFDSQTNHLCSLNDPNSCLNMPNPFDGFHGYATHGAPVSDTVSAWTFQAV